MRRVAGWATFLGALLVCVLGMRFSIAWTIRPIIN